MTSLGYQRGLVVLVYLCAVAGLSWGVWSYGYAQALGQVAARGQADLALASDRLVKGLLRYRSAAVLMVDHPAFAALHSGGQTQVADDLLLESLDKTGALYAYYADRSGRVLAAAPDAPEGDLAGRAYFERALDGALGVAHGVDSVSGKRAYIYATPSFGPEGRVRGVLVIAVDLDTVERDWRGTRPAVYFSDAAGQIFVTNRSEILFWQRNGARYRDETGANRVVHQRWVGEYELWVQEFSPYVPSKALHLQRPLPVIGMTGEALLDVAPARRLAGLQAAVMAVICVMFGLALFLVTERRRALAQANVLLEARVRARTMDLEGANARLRDEVREREEAEAALRRAQADLVQAGKLSALGQMSAGISHELNQPLMAIQQFADNGQAFLGKGRVKDADQNLSRISGLASRAARIIRNLRAFARNESEPMGKVDLVRVLDQAVELTQSRLTAADVTMVWASSEVPIFVLGGEVRLTQVFVNLINNAVDAMSAQADKRIDLILEQDARLGVLVRDNGPGIADPDRVFEPFYTTKQVGDDGMGLGLSISYGLVQSFGGHITGANSPLGGAEFRVELERWTGDRDD